MGSEMCIRDRLQIYLLVNAHISEFDAANAAGAHLSQTLSMVHGTRGIYGLQDAAGASPGDCLGHGDVEERSAGGEWEEHDEEGDEDDKEEEG